MAVMMAILDIGAIENLHVAPIGQSQITSGTSGKFGQRPCLFHFFNFWYKNKVTKQTVKILMRRLIRSRLILISTICKRMSEFT